MIAVFDRDGVCVAVAAHPGRQPPGGAKAEVPQHTRPQQVWWDGERVRDAEPCSLIVPETVEFGEPFELPLPEGVVAEVNGVRQRGTLTIAADAPRGMFVKVMGAQHGDFRLEVQDYAAKRRAEYPSIADQLDALWKGGSAAEGMRRRVSNVKQRHPKT